jgi:hypothetical protein
LLWGIIHGDHILLPTLRLDLHIAITPMRSSVGAMLAFAAVNVVQEHTERRLQ